MTSLSKMTTVTFDHQTILQRRRVTLTSVSVMLSWLLLAMAPTKASAVAVERETGPVPAIAGLIGTVSTNSATSLTAPGLRRGTLRTARAKADLSHSARVPLAGAGVYAYRVTDRKIHQAQTDLRGGFSFAALPAGVYKLIVHKTGFLPAVALVTRTAASSFQELQLQLFPAEADTANKEASADFWEIRKRIPSDVLRSIEVTERYQDRFQQPSQRLQAFASPFTATMHALTGSGDFASAPADLVGGHIDINGQLGELDLGLTGNLRTLETKEAQTVGRTQALTLNLSHEASGSLNISSRVDSIDGRPDPVDLERYGVGWERDIGSGTTAIKANFISETNYYRDANINLVDVPASSETIDIEGTYNQRLGSRTGVATGVRYRERAPSRAPTAAIRATAPATERVDVFGLGDLALKPSVSLLYGLHTTLADGSVAVAPEGGVVFSLAENWTAETSVRQRLYQTADEWTPGFYPAHYRQQFECTTAEEGCYRFRVKRDLGQGDGLELGALYRNFADTIRLYFTDDVFDDLDSLILVNGDRLPELHLALTRRLSPNVVTRVASNLAHGGGGTVGAQLENRVSYMVTSIEGQFERSATGITLSFHSLNQGLLDRNGAEAQDPVEKDRVQLQITQGLPRLAGFADDLNLILDMQVSRANGQQIARAASDELSRRILGGIALRF